MNKSSSLYICIFCFFILGSLCAEEIDSLANSKKEWTRKERFQKKNRFIINTGSFVYHIRRLNNYTEKFDNAFIGFGVRTGKSTHFLFGTSRNSGGSRGVVIGLQKNWYDFNPRFHFEGLYAYVGEFFFGILSDDDFGESGDYKRIKDITGIPWGWAPYIYHGLKYDLLPYLSLQGGILVGGLAIFSIQWSIY